MDRRTFLAATAAATIGTRSLASEESAGPRLRVGVIGHTGRGNFGHGLDTVWLNAPNTEIVGVADADPDGLAAAIKRLRLTAGHLDYREMLDEIRPEIVAVCPRHPDQHRDMMLAAIAAGAEAIYVEKPFCRTPAEADEIIAAAAGRTKIAVAHRNRYHPVLPTIQRLIAAGAIGKPLEIRGRGKGDRRGGCEDLWVLGSHVLNLVHYFGGAPKSCSAVIRQDGRPVTADDVRDGNEGLGPVAGNQLHARYELADGLIAYFDSIADDGTGGQAFGLQIIGSEGVIDCKCDRFPLAHLRAGNPFDVSRDPHRWVPITSAGVGLPEPNEDLAKTLSGHLIPVADLIDAVANDREPLCGAEESALTVEMICATFASHAATGRSVEFPLRSRENELANL